MSNKYTPIGSSLRFHIPKTLESDFDNFLNNDIPNQVMDFTAYKDWFNKTDVKTVRGELYPDTSKSLYENIDNNMNIRFSKSAPVEKGDIVIDENGRIYVLDWGINPEHNNKASRAVVCNMELTVSRWIEAETDELGYKTIPAHDELIVDKLPVNIYKYNGRPEWAVNNNIPGVLPNALTILTVQVNSKTKDLKLKDKFMWGTDEYEIVDINLNGVNFIEDGGRGTLKIEALKLNGGDRS